MDLSILCGTALVLHYTGCLKWSMPLHLTVTANASRRLHPFPFKGRVTSGTTCCLVTATLTRFDRHGLGKQDTQRIRDLLTEVDLYPSYGIVYLENSGFRDPKTGLKFWGSPNQPEFCGWAFANEDRAAAARVSGI